ncbi:acetyl-CoA C-acyltransferase [Actinotalea sp. M2MS4P-6]|uniref:acetyl-CoA C-acyltransferase n=1 Tax=Actinotalea sp. M2MS4P-6 TaxID=2983762 RepID=UPI0021E4D7E4|nr:acetyl-CoA C-acyltransferase [Actinotalea sp. M2MS4P-6]MCV2394300.1 acetyl-CoA C-acyltransferase [Actinotalea sp. M2MS4P-6]
MSSAPTDVVVVGAARTPNGRLKGGLATVPAVELGAIAIRAALERSGVPASAVGPRGVGRGGGGGGGAAAAQAAIAPGPAPARTAGPASAVQHVVMGHVLQAGLGQCTARQAAVAAGLGWDVPAISVNKVCLSGLSAIIDAARMIRAGEAEVAVAGGMESMTNAPHVLMGSRFGYGFGDVTVVDSMANDGLSDAWSHEAMGLDTERRTADYPADRAEQDVIAARSHQLAAKAWDEGVFDAEVVPVTVKQRKGETVVARDEGIRPESTTETLGALRPAFAPDGSITAGNASTINDGGAAVVLTTRARAEAEGWTVLATLRAHAQVAGPSPALAPQPGNAILAALKAEGWSVEDLDLLEINEAFAAVAVHAVRQLGVPLEKVNVHGGAVALGHPIGQSGARLVVHLAHELHRRGGGRAAAALCGGTGQGDALLLEG